jgi:hypothetical protein
MTYRTTCRTIVAGVSVVAIFGFRTALAQEPDVDPAVMCDAVAASYQAYALSNDDPDKDAATARVTEGVTDCKNGNTEVGLRKINEGTVMIHDHEKTKMK